VACCQALADRGHHVVVVDFDAERAESVARDLGDATAAPVDVTDATGVKELVAQFERIDVLVNLAGVIRRASLAKITTEDFRLTLSTHVEGTLNTMQAVAPVMREHGYGRIVNTSSIAVRGTIAGGSYGAAKGAIEGLTRSVAIELAPAGITVNCVAPGLVDAGIFLTTPEEYRDEYASRVPIGRLAEPAEIASCVAFLASREASYVTGQTLTVCGGLTLGF
jgi:3-oxoacyl-[acyl-carrier protein] reductase